MFVLLCGVKIFLLLIQWISFEVGKGDLCRLAVHLHYPLHEGIDVALAVLGVLIVHGYILPPSLTDYKNYF